MKINQVLSVVACALLTNGCATIRSVDARSDALRNRDLAWATAAAEGANIDAILSFWSEDAIVIPPGAPELRGKSAIRVYVQKSLAIPGFKITWKPSSATVSSDGSLGYTTGENVVSFSAPDGKSVTVMGRYATIWRRDEDGQWKCVVDIWNTP